MTKSKRPIGGLVWLGGAFVFAVMTACTDDDPSPREARANAAVAQTTTTRVTSTLDRAEPQAAARGARPSRGAIALRVTALTPAEGGPVAVGDTLEPARVIDVGARSLVLDFERGGRVEIEPHTRFARSDASPTGVTLGEGSLHVVLSPEGGSQRPPLRVATPSGTVEIGGSGELWVTVLPDGTAFVAQLAGLADVYPGAVAVEAGASAGARPLARRVVAGRSIVLGESLGEPVAGPRTIEAARAASSRLVRGRHRATAAALAQRREALERMLTARIRAFDEELGNGRELQRLHREAVTARDPGAMAVQQRVVLHSQALLRSRVAVQLGWEKARAESILADDDGAWLVPFREGASRSVPSLRDR